MIPSMKLKVKASDFKGKYPIFQRHVLVSQPCKNVKQMLFTLKTKMKIKKTNTTFHLEILSNQNSNMIFLLFALKSKMKIRKPPLSWMSILNLESHSVSLRLVWGGL